jgi:hypothetical protein
VLGRGINRSQEHELPVGLTDLTLSCAAGSACRSRSGATVAADDVRENRVATCDRRDVVALAIR